MRDSIPVRPIRELVGRTLNDRWKIISTTGWNLESYLAIDRIADRYDDDGFFSVTYKASDLGGGEDVFIKCLDLRSYYDMEREEGKSLLDIISNIGVKTKFERDILTHCQRRHLRHVVRLLDQNELVIDANDPLSIIPFFVFELADGNLRTQKRKPHARALAWDFRVLHNTANGLRELHQLGVTHQDIKPANILEFGDQEVFKIGDMGRVCTTGIDLNSPFNDEPFSGDISYAPPEHLYNYAVGDRHQRHILADLYMLGSVAIYLTLGQHLNTYYVNELPSDMHWINWVNSGGNYELILPILIDLHSKLIKEVSSLGIRPKDEQRFTLMLDLLCHPDPRVRGYVDVSGRRTLSLERVVSGLDLIARNTRVRENIS